MALFSQKPAPKQQAQKPVASGPVLWMEPTECAHENVESHVTFTGWPDQDLPPFRVVIVCTDCGEWAYGAKKPQPPALTQGGR